MVLNVKEGASVGQKTASALSSMSGVGLDRRWSTKTVARYALEPFMADAIVARP